MFVTVAEAVLAERCGRLHCAFRGVCFMGSFVFRSDLLTGHEPSRTRDDDEDEDEDEKRGQLPPVPHPASRTPHSEDVGGKLRAITRGDHHIRLGLECGFLRTRERGRGQGQGEQAWHQPRGPRCAVAGRGGGRRMHGKAGDDGLASNYHDPTRSRKWKSSKLVLLCAVFTIEHATNGNLGLTISGNSLRVATVREDRECRSANIVVPRQGN